MFFSWHPRTPSPESGCVVEFWCSCSIVVFGISQIDLVTHGSVPGLLYVLPSFQAHCFLQNLSLRPWIGTSFVHLLSRAQVLPLRLSPGSDFLFCMNSFSSNVLSGAKLLAATCFTHWTPVGLWRWSFVYTLCISSLILVCWCVWVLSVAMSFFSFICHCCVFGGDGCKAWIY